LGQRTLSLDQPIVEDGNAALLDLLVDDSIDINDDLHDRALGQQLKNALTELDALHRDVVRLRFGLGGARPHTPRAIALLLHRPTREIEHAEQRALEMLREGLQAFV
jgi:DNA-directed RNA polymerase sigma subunit (sigma70/sigma32)